MIQSRHQRFFATCLLALVGCPFLLRAQQPALPPPLVPPASLPSTPNSAGTPVMSALPSAASSPTPDPRDAAPPLIAPPVATPAPGTALAPARQNILLPSDPANKGVFNDVESRAIDARRQAELSVNVDPSVPQTYRSTDNISLRTLLLILAKQSRIAYVEPPFKDDALISFYSPTPILPIDAFKTVAKINGYHVSQDATGIYTLSRSDISIPSFYVQRVYQLHNIQPPYALASVAQALNFKVERPSGIISTYANPSGGGGSDSSGGSSGGDSSSSSSGGGSGGLTGGSSSSASDEQVQARYTGGFPMDTPVSRREDKTSGATALIYIDRARRSIVLYDTEENQRRAERLLETVDRLEPQIRLETQVVQVARNNDTNIGFDWTQTFGAGATFSFSPGVSNAGVSNFFFYPTAGVLSYPTISTTLHALENKGIVRTLNHTWSTMRQGVPTPISDTTEESVVLQSGYTGSTSVSTGSGTSSTAGGGLSSTSQIQVYHYGVSFDAICWLLDNGKVDINLNPQISTKTGSTQTVEGPIPIIERQRTTQAVIVPTGKTFCFGGIVRASTGNQTTRIPYLGRIPVVGELFTYHEKNDDVGTLIYFVTPTIIPAGRTPELKMQPDDAQYMSDFNRQRPVYGSEDAPTYRGEQSLPAPDSYKDVTPVETRRATPVTTKRVPPTHYH